MARDFNGTTQYLAKTSTPITAVPVTMASWMYPRSIETTGAQIAVGILGDAANRLSLQTRGATGGDPLTFQVRNDATTVTSADTTSGYSANAWQHACGSIDGSGNLAVYLNGASKGTNTSTVDYLSFTDVAIGARIEITVLFPFNGLLAEAAMWDAVLTDAEVAILALGYSPLLVRPQSLVYYVPVIGRTSPEIDLVGGYDMTLNAAPTVAAHPPVIYPSRQIYTPPISERIYRSPFYQPVRRISFPISSM